MIALWISVTIAAAFLQNLRSALQKAVKGRLSTAGAAYARFIYALPLALVYLWALTSFGGFETPEPNLAFLLWCAAGGLSQILFTVVLLWLFSFREVVIRWDYYLQLVCRQDSSFHFVKAVESD